MKNNPLKLLVIVIIGSAVAGLLWNVFITSKDSHGQPNDTTPVASEDTTPAQSVNSMCYYSTMKTKKGLFDRQWLVMNIEGSKTVGEYHNIPAEKDSKIGIFEGTVGDINPDTKTQVAQVWWDAQSEGMADTEELVFEFGDGGAQVGYGEMLPQGDDVYTYKDKSKIVYNTMMSQIDCGSLNELLSVEKYIRDNKATVLQTQDATNADSALDVNTVSVDTAKKQATIAYTDGKTKGTLTVSYTFDTGSGTVTISQLPAPQQGTDTQASDTKTTQ